MHFEDSRSQKTQNRQEKIISSYIGKDNNMKNMLTENQKNVQQNLCYTSNQIKKNQKVQNRHNNKNSISSVSTSTHFNTSDYHYIVTNQYRQNWQNLSQTTNNPSQIKQNIIQSKIILIQSKKSQQKQYLNPRIYHQKYLNSDRFNQAQKIQVVKVKDFKKKSNMKRRFDNLSLSNIGNTCYMNSTIQILAGCGLFVHKIKNTKFKSYNVLSILNKIFLQFEQNESDSRIEYKTYLLEDLLKLIGKKNMDFLDKRQQDAVQFLILLVNTIIQQDQSFNQIFRFKYQTKCKKKQCITKQTSKFEDILIFLKELKCNNCGQQKKIYFQNSPEIILLACQNMTQYETYLITEDSKKQQAYYFLSGRVEHSGSEQFGHYIATRKYNSSSTEWILCNDSHIRQVNFQKDSYRYQCRVLLYQKSNLTSQQNKKIISQQQKKKKLQRKDENRSLLYQTFDLFKKNYKTSIFSFLIMAIAQHYMHSALLFK